MRLPMFTAETSLGGRPSAYKAKGAPATLIAPGTVRAQYFFCHGYFCCNEYGYCIYRGPVLF